MKVLRFIATCVLGAAIGVAIYEVSKALHRQATLKMIEPELRAIEARLDALEDGR